MKKAKIFLILFLTLSVIFFLGFLSIRRFLPTKLKFRVYSKESQTAGVVEVEAIPKQLNPGKEMIFTLNLNNHSIDLSYDYTKTVTVVDNNGNTYKPINWTGGQGGHHISGDLIFGKLSNNATHVGLNIKGVDNKNVIFDWEL